MKGVGGVFEEEFLFLLYFDNLLTSLVGNSFSGDLILSNCGVI